MFKPSKESQWNERADAPIASSYEGKQDLDQFQLVLAMSYKCDRSNIYWKITRDEHSTDWVLVHYYMKTKYLGKQVDREIFSKKVPIPAHIKNKINLTISPKKVDEFDRGEDYYKNNEFTFEPCQPSNQSKEPEWVPRTSDLFREGFVVKETAKNETQEQQPESGDPKQNEPTIAEKEVASQSPSSINFGLSTVKVKISKRN